MNESHMYGWYGHDTQMYNATTKYLLIMSTQSRKIQLPNTHDQLTAIPMSSIHRFQNDSYHNLPSSIYTLNTTPLVWVTLSSANPSIGRCAILGLQQTWWLFLKPQGRKEGNVLFNDVLNTFYLRLYGIMVKDHSDSKRGNPLLPHELLVPISSKGSFICIIPQRGRHIPQPLLHQSWSTGWNEK